MTFQKFFLAIVVFILVQIHQGLRQQRFVHRSGFGTTLFGWTPLRPTGQPSIKDYVDIKVKNDINDELSKIFNRIDEALNEIKQENAKSLAETKASLADTKQENAIIVNEIRQTVKDLESKLTGVQVNVNTGIATLKVFIGLFAFVGFANIVNLLSFMKKLF